MFISIKKKSIIIGVVLVLISVGCCFIFSATAKGVSSAPATGKTIVVDAGHGGADGGVTGTHSGIKESDINLAIARSLKNILKSNGYNVVMTRSTTDGLYGMATSHKKQKDMQARKDIIANSGGDLVVSVHCNSYPRKDSKGAQVFFAPRSTEGQKQANIMQSVLNTSLKSTRLAMSGDYFILQCSSIPSILVECGFLTNPEEEKLLAAADYQEKVAYGIFTGIHTILSE